MSTSEGQSPATQKVRAFLDAVLTIAWSALPDGSLDFINQRFLDYSGLSSEQLLGWEWKSVVHPEDIPQLQIWWESVRRSEKAGTTEKRLRRFDGAYHWFRIAAAPVHDEQANLVRWCGINTDIDDLKQTEEELRASERSWRRIVDCIPGFVTTATAEGEIEFSNQQFLNYFGKTLEELKSWKTIDVIHPSDLPQVIAGFRHFIETGQPWDDVHRIRRADGVYRWFQSRVVPQRDAEGRIIRWFSLLADIDDLKHAEQKLRESEENLRTITNNIPGFVHTADAAGEVGFINDQILQYFGKTREELRDWASAGVVHPDDLPRVLETFRRSIETGQDCDVEVRSRRADGVYRWFQSRGQAVRDREGRITAWYFLLTDIDDRKRAEEKVRQSEADLRTITDTIRQPIVVLASDGTILYANRVALDLAGLTIAEANDKGFFARIFHPDDVERLIDERNVGLAKGIPFDSETRMLLKNGQNRWQLLQYNPLKDESGNIIRWYVTSTDIDDRRRAEERLQNENLVLREEIDRSSMFEEIVGSSKPMREVLKQVEKVAPSDTTVLILGETGTGKELIARALHRRSKRAARAFVRVNCAAIPQSLIASELFGHEKGAFTGALQRRVGRFEAADGGTLFLDEIGDLPAETQIALLRVLQEKEFERVGSNHSISVDVRLIAATNRGLSAAVAAGSFRQDLFYRLNVFPIAVPPLRERAEDIPLLVEYFVGRFAQGAGKNIRHISKNSLEELKGYSWPGNIRELQNVLERAVILNETDTLVIDESWLKRESADSSPHEGLSASADREVKMIETALAESNGRISGPFGAAAKLGIPRQTLESKIRRLGIGKYRHKRPASK